MKGILEFNLEDSIDEAAYIRAVKSTKLAISLWEMDQYLRSQIKHAPDSMSDEVYKTLEETRDKLYEIMSDNAIDLDELLK
jgi:hypothetical protein